MRADLSDEEASAECRDLLIACVEHTAWMNQPGVRERVMRLPAFSSNGRRRIVARVAGLAVGFIDFTIDEIKWLMVHPQWARRGVGRKLVEAVEACLNGDVTVMCVEANIEGRRFYERLGFGTERQGVRGKMFGVEFSNVVMVKRSRQC